MKTGKPRILILGHTGKMGTAIASAFSDQYSIDGRSSKDFDAADFASVEAVIDESRPAMVFNGAALLGIDPCEANKDLAFRLNALYPKRLAELSNEKKFFLVHFSTDAVFDDHKNDFYVESDTPSPVNVYGQTKYEGDRFIQQIAERYYIIRLSVLFGETSKQTQFVEKMIQRIQSGQRILTIADDVIASPSYSLDVALGIKQLLNQQQPVGLYHMANEGKASLYELMKEVVQRLGLTVGIEAGSYKDFPFVGVKNTNTPIRSEKIDSLRPWREAVAAYCLNLKNQQKWETTHNERR